MSPADPPAATTEPPIAGHQMRAGLLWPRVWRRRGPAARLLLPLSWLFRGAVRARRAAYVHGLRRVEGAAVPVVVVGSITVGGSGKTPLVMHLARLLARRGCRPGIVSRGYGSRPPCEPLRVTASTPVEHCGDEPAMMARRLSLPVVVDRDRPRGVRELVERLGCNVVISDDGLQHYAMARQVEIAVLGGEAWAGNGYCLPAGPLREPVSRLEAVDLVVCNGGPQRTDAYAMAVHLASLHRLRGDGEQPLAAMRDRQVHAVAATGRPERFFDMLSGHGLAIEAHPFPDHHGFCAADFAGMGDAPIVMTEKDAVKCAGIPLHDAWFARARVELEDGFENKLIELLNL